MTGQSPSPTPLYAIGLAAGLCIGLFNFLSAVHLAGTGYGTAEVGLGGTAFFLGLAVGSLLTGRWMPRLGFRTTLLLAATIITLVGSNGAGIAGLVAMLTLRALMGLAVGALMISAQTAVNTLCHHDKRTSANGIYGLAVGIGLGAGPLLGGMLYERWGSDAFLSLSTILPVVILLTARLPATLQTATTEQEEPHRRMRLQLPLLAAFAYGLAEASLLSVLPVYLLRVGADAAQAGLGFFAFALGGLVTTLPLSMLADRVGTRAILGIIAFIGALALLSGMMALNLTAAVIAAAMAGGAIGPVYVVALSLTAQRTGTATLGLGIAWFGVAFGIGSTVGPGLSAYAMALGGDSHFFTPIIAMFVLVAAASAFDGRYDADHHSTSSAHPKRS